MIVLLEILELLGDFKAGTSRYSFLKSVFFLYE
jgi:hypothetical protein